MQLNNLQIQNHILSTKATSAKQIRFKLQLSQCIILNNIAQKQFFLTVQNYTKSEKKV